MNLYYQLVYLGGPREILDSNRYPPWEITIDHNLSWGIYQFIFNLARKGKTRSIRIVGVPIEIPYNPFRVDSTSLVRSKVRGDIEAKCIYAEYLYESEIIRFIKSFALECLCNINLLG